MNFAASTTNILGGPLEACVQPGAPATGFTRNNRCEPHAGDAGRHLVCAIMDQPFLEFTRAKGNDLSSVVAPGEPWCLCEGRWNEAFDAGVAPKVVRASTSGKVRRTTVARILATIGNTIEQGHYHSHRRWRSLKAYIQVLAQRYPAHKTPLQRFFNKQYTKYLQREQKKI